MRGKSGALWDSNLTYVESDACFGWAFRLDNIQNRLIL